MQGAYSRPCQQSAWPFILISGFFCVLLLLIWLDLASNDFVHPLYDGTSMWFVFLASVVILFMAVQRGLALQILSVLLTGFYTQRVVVTYFAPESFDYNGYVGFTTLNLESASQFYFLSVLFMLLGAVFLPRFLIGFFSNKRHAASVDFATIHYLNFRVDFSKLCRMALWIVIVGYLYKFMVMLSGFGLTGSVYSADETILKWSIGIVDVLSPFAMFSVIFFSKSSREKRLAMIALFLEILSGFAMASKGFLVGMLITYYLDMRLIGRRISSKFLFYAVFFVVFSIFVFFPAMTVLRNTWLSGGLTFDFDYYVKLMSSAFLSFSNRLGGFDWMTLWLAVSPDKIPRSATVLGELISLINMLVPGEIIAQPDAVNLSKLQVILGRGVGQLYELGGHAENQGGLATAYIIWGKATALAYLAVWAGGLTALGNACVHPFHKATILFSYLIVFVIGGGFVLMHGTFFWYLVFTTFLVVVLKLYARASELIKPKGRKIKDGQDSMPREFPCSVQRGAKS